MKKTIAKAALSLLLTAIANTSCAQPDSCWTLLLLEKSHTLEERPDMATVSSQGFYLYRNCIYDISLKNDRRYSTRLVDIKKDTLLFTNYFNQAVAALNHHLLDTMAIPATQLARLHLVADRSLGIFQGESFGKYDFIFKKQAQHCALPSDWVQLYSNDTAHYELVPYLTAQGLDLLYESGGFTYYFQGTGAEKPAEEPIDTTYDTRNFVWYTPCKVEKINGLAIGLMAQNDKNGAHGEDDSLLINGLNLELNPIAFMFVPYCFVSEHKDSVCLGNNIISRRPSLKINGASISTLGVIKSAKINGLNVAGVITVAHTINGLSVSSLKNLSYCMNGLSLAVLQNYAMRGKGLQVALYNKAADLRGLQIGLWNVNGRRALPLINWQFKARKHA